jgi:hypothetical protein
VHRCLWTGHSIPPFYTLPPFFIFFFFHFHGLEICKTAIICRFLIAETETVWRNLRVPRKWSLDHRCLWTAHSIPPFYTLPPPLFSFFIHFHGLEICKTAIICRFYPPFFIFFPFISMA